MLPTYSNNCEANGLSANYSYNGGICDQKAFFTVNIHVLLVVYLFTCFNKYSKIKQKF